MSAPDSAEPTTLTRRTLAKAAAWSIPALAAAVAAPLASASPGFDVALAGFCRNGEIGANSRGFTITVVGTLPAGSEFLIESFFPGISLARLEVTPAIFTFASTGTYSGVLTTTADLTNTQVTVGIRDSGMIAGAGEGRIYWLTANFTDAAPTNNTAGVNPGITIDLLTVCYA